MSGPPRSARFWAGLFALVVVGGLVGWRLSITTQWWELESTVKGVGVDGAAEPTRVDHGGSPLCDLPIPFGGWCPYSRLLFDSGDETPLAYREQWKATLVREGWKRHAPGTYSVPEWWTKNNVSLVLLIREEELIGPLFKWGVGDLLVEAQGVGLYRGRYPATDPPLDPQPPIPPGCAPARPTPACGPTPYPWVPVPR